jgi:nitrite reductase/ring-hydroxylating ferredoxin subunit
MTRREPADRRGFLTKLAAVACGGLATLTPVAAGLWAFLDPLRRRGGGGRFLPVTELAAVPDDGVPRRFAVVADRKDAWTGYASEPIGAVWLRREPGAGAVQALSATCPHAGCFVEMEPAEHCFRCPCHNSSFTLDGGIVAPSPSPRPMDELECRIGHGGAVEVKWQNFFTGIAEKVARP